MNWQAIGETIVAAAGDSRVMATVLITGFVLLLIIGRYGGDRE